MKTTLLLALFTVGCVAPSGEDTDTRVAALDGATTTTDQAAYVVGETLTVTWSGLPGNATDWVGIAPAGSEPTNVVRWNYIGGQAAGSYTFNFKFAAGTFVARTFLNDGYEIAAESAPFTFTNSSTLTTPTPNFTKGQTIVINWANIPDNANDWIAISPAGTDTINRWFYTNGAQSGSRAVPSQPDGSYVARLFMNDSYEMLAEVPFTVGGAATVTTDRAIYSPNLPITVTWSGLPGMSNDWIGIAPAGSDPTTVTAWSYIGGQAAGNHVFLVGTPGTYVARAFPTDTYNVAGESAPFTVGVQCAVSATSGHITIRNAADVAAAANLTVISGNLTIAPEVAGLDVNLPCVETTSIVAVQGGSFPPAAVRLPRLDHTNGSLRIVVATPTFEAPNLVSIAGALTIRDTALTSLSTFANLSTLFTLQVFDNPNITSLAGLGKVTSLSTDLKVYAPSVAGLENLVSVGGNADIKTTSDTDGLVNLGSVGGTLTVVAPEVELLSLTSANSFISQGPSTMTRLFAPLLTSVPAQLTIKNHAQLPQCYATALLGQLSPAPAVVDISGLNAGGTCP